MIGNKPPKNSNLDPLYIIFEQHLFNFQDSTTDRKTFISKVVEEYISFLRRNRIAVPPQMEALIADELGTQVNTMLVKKIYGCLAIEDFQKGLTPDQRIQAKSRYVRLRAKAG